MAEQTGRFEWIAKLARIWLVGAAAVLLLSLVVTVIVIVGRLLGGAEKVELAAWVLLALFELVAWAWVCVIYGMVRLQVAKEFNVENISGRIGRLETLLEDQAASTKRLVDLAQLSDKAKSLLFREREIEAFREVIRDDLLQQDYKTAEAFIQTMETTFGYADEAARLRQEVADTRKATLDERIDSAVRRINEIVERHDWPRAMRETQRMLRLFPNNPKIQGLPERIEAARTKHKRDLLQAYGESARKNDVDRGIELLRELDRYLTPQEAAALEESARGVFRAKLHNLGVQFAICVTDKQWARAVATGEEIVNEFPNSRMAQEVRQKMDSLRARAAATPE